METNDSNRSLWRFIDGSASIPSVFSMLIAVTINNLEFSARLWGIGIIKRLSDQNDGVIILETLLLFPFTLALYRVLQMFFAAKEAVQKRATKRGRREGRESERERIKRVLATHGITPPPEIDCPPAEGVNADRPQR